jgi:hypothetical protein
MIYITYITRIIVQAWNLVTSRFAYSPFRWKQNSDGKGPNLRPNRWRSTEEEKEEEENFVFSFSYWAQIAKQVKLFFARDWNRFRIKWGIEKFRKRSNFSFTSQLYFYVATFLLRFAIRSVCKNGSSVLFYIFF